MRAVIVTGVNDEILADGGISNYFVGDISLPENCEKLVKFTIEKYGQIDVLVHNAGLIDLKKIENLTQEEVLKTFQVNIISPIILTQKSIPHLRKTKGKVIFINSGAAIKQIHGWSTYCTTKAALLQFANCLSIEEPEITTISIRPGRVDTDMMNKIRSDGENVMNSKDYEGFVEAKKNDELLTPDFVAKVTAKIIVNAPLNWSGKFVSVLDEKILENLNSN